MAATAVAATGCLGRGEDGDGSNGTDTGGNTTDSTGDGTESSNGDEGGEAEPTGFRSWLTDERLREDSNLRFDYARGYTEAFVGERVEPLDLSSESVDGHVTQSGTTAHLGEFDVGEMTDRVEAADGFRTTGEYEGYVVSEGSLEAGDREVSFPVAVGEDAVLVGDNYEAAIDAHLGDRETIEEVEPDFGVLFDELPLDEAASVAGQYGTPTGTGSSVSDYVSVSGTAHETPTGGDTTWVYVFDDADDVTPKRAGILASSITAGEVNDTGTDGRVVRLEGELTVPGGQ